jgi:spore coat protein H
MRRRRRLSGQMRWPVLNGVGLTLAVLGCAPSEDAPPNYDAIFEQGRVALWALTVDDEQWRGLQADPETYVPASLTVGDRVYAQVGLRLMGRQLRPKRNLRIRFNSFVEEQRFFGVKRVNLRSGWGDPSMIREALTLSLMRRAGIPAPRWAFVWVELNGNGGLYTLVEQVDRKFLADRLGDRDGNLYKLERGGDLVYRGDAIDDYPLGIYELKTDEARAPWEDLIVLMRILAKASDEQLARALPSHLDVDGFLRALALNAWLVNMNAYPGTADNAYLYRATDGRFHYIPWDLPQSFGDYHGRSCGLSTEELIALDFASPTCGADRPLVDRLLGLPSLQRRYRAELETMTENMLRADLVLERARQLQQLIAEWVRRDGLKNIAYTEFEDSLERDLPNERDPERTPGLRRFVQARAEAATSFLAGP